MRRKDKEVTDLNLIHAVIYQAEVCRLALVDGEKPYLIPLSFGFDGTHIYIHSAASGRKIELLKANNQVCVEFEQFEGILPNDNPCNWSARYFTVIGSGQAELLVDNAEQNYGLNQIIRHYSPEAVERMFTEQELAKLRVYKIKPTELTGKVSGMKQTL